VRRTVLHERRKVSEVGAIEQLLDIVGERDCHKSSSPSEKIIALDFRYGIQPKMLFIGGEFSCASRMFVAIFP
jgi:hypothetical protein